MNLQPSDLSAGDEQLASFVCTVISQMKGQGALTWSVLWHGVVTVSGSDLYVCTSIS